MTPISTLEGLALACADGPGGERQIQPTGPAGQIGSIPHFSDWITEPVVFNDPPVTTLFLPGRRRERVHRDHDTAERYGRGHLGARG